MTPEEKDIFPNKNLDPEFERIYREQCIKLIPTKGYDGNPEKISCEHRNEALANTIQIYYPSILGMESKEEVVKNHTGFSCITISEANTGYTHWSTGLKMILLKDGIKIKLDSEEIKELVASLPRTMGGSY